LLYTLWDVGVDQPGRGQRLADMLHDYGHRGLGSKRYPTGEHLIEHHPQGVDIGPAVHCQTLALFGRHVLRGTDKAGYSLPGALDHESQPKIGQDDLAFRGQEDIGWFDIAVDYPSAMSIVKRF
jgi:hypothetical protein